MTGKIYFFIVLLLLSTEILANEHPFSIRTGNIIDSTEAKYFSLFRDYKGFVKAEIIADSDGSRKINIVYEHGEADKTIDLTPDQSKNLRLYIENYELYLHEDIVFDNSKIPDAIQLDQSKIRDFINLDYFFRDMPPVEIELIDGEMIDDCGLVAIVGDTLILAKERNRYNWRDVENFIPIPFNYVFECMVDGVVYELHAEPVDRNELIDHYSGLPFYDHPKNDFSIPPEVKNKKGLIMANEKTQVIFERDKLFPILWRKKDLSDIFFLSCSFQIITKEVVSENKFEVEDQIHIKRIYHVREQKNNKNLQSALNLNLGYFFNNHIFLYSGLKLLVCSSKDEEETFRDKGFSLAVGIGWHDLPIIDRIYPDLSFGIILECDYNFYNFYHQLSSQGEKTWIPELVLIKEKNYHYSFSFKPYSKYNFFDNISVTATFVYEYHPVSNYSTSQYISDSLWPSYWEMIKDQKYSGIGFSIGIEYIL